MKRFKLEKIPNILAYFIGALIILKGVTDIIYLISPSNPENPLGYLLFYIIEIVFGLSIILLTKSSSGKD